MMLKNEMFCVFFPTRLAITNVGKYVRKQAMASIIGASIHRYRLFRGQLSNTCQDFNNTHLP